MTTATPSNKSAQNSTLRIQPLTKWTGAQCTGIDLTHLKQGEWELLLNTYHSYLILVIREQTLSKLDQIAFSERFGELELPVRADYRGMDYPALHVVSNMGADGKPNPTAALDNPGNFFWHTDASYMRRPASTTLLYGVEIPPSGGDTLFANMHAAYDALCDELKTSIEGLNAIHSWEQSRYNSGSRPASEAEIEAAPPIAHPLVRTHPKTGRKGVYIGNHTSHIEGMSIEEGRALLNQLLEHATQPQFLYRHKWCPGDIVVWDNRSLLHKASDDFDMGNYVRLLHRTVVQGDIPRGSEEQL